MINTLRFDDDGRIFELTPDGVVTREADGETTQGVWSSENANGENKLTFTLNGEEISYPVRYRFLNQESGMVMQRNVLKVAVLGEDQNVLGEERFHGSIVADDAKDLDYVLSDDTKFTLYGKLVLKGDYSVLKVQFDEAGKDVARIISHKKAEIKRITGATPTGRKLGFQFTCHTLDFDQENNISFFGDGRVEMQGSVRPKGDGLTFVGSFTEGGDDMNIALLGSYNAYEAGIRIEGDPQNPEVQLELFGEWEMNSFDGSLSLSLAKDEQGTLSFKTELEFEIDGNGPNEDNILGGTLRISREGDDGGNASTDGQGEIEIELGLKGNFQLQPDRKLVFELNANSDGKKVALALQGTLTWSDSKAFTFKLGYSEDNIEVTIMLEGEKLDAWVSIIKNADNTATIGIRLELKFNLAGDFQATNAA